MVKDCFSAEDIAPLHFKELSKAATTMVQKETGEQSAWWEVGARPRSPAWRLYALPSPWDGGKWPVLLGGRAAGWPGTTGLLFFFNLSLFDTKSAQNICNVTKIKGWYSPHTPVRLDCSIHVLSPFMYI